MLTLYIQHQQADRQYRTIIKDEQDSPRYLMVGNWGNHEATLTLYELDGQVAARIKQANLSLFPTYHLYSGNEKVGSMRKLLHYPKDFYYVPGLNWSVIGDIPKKHYSIHHFQKTIMTMTTFENSRGAVDRLNVTNAEDAPLAICIAVVLNYWLVQRQRDAERPPWFQPGNALAFS